MTSTVHTYPWPWYLQLPRSDKYNPKIKKYYVEYEDEDEDIHAEEEREVEQETTEAGHACLCKHSLCLSGCCYLHLISV